MDPDNQDGRTFQYEKIRAEIQLSVERYSRQRLEPENTLLKAKSTGNLDNEGRRKVLDSVKLTKALVLLGYSCWSQLEPGICQYIQIVML